MKKYFALVAMMTTPFVVFAASDAQTAVVEKIYQQASVNSDSLAILKKHADASFLKAIAVAERKGAECMDSDPIWGNQDPQTNAKVSFTRSGNQVTARFKQYDQMTQVRYALTCNGNQCAVSDVNKYKSQWSKCR